MAVEDVANKRLKNDRSCREKFPSRPARRAAEPQHNLSMITLVMSLCVDALPVHVYGVSTITGLV